MARNLTGLLTIKKENFPVEFAIDVFVVIEYCICVCSVTRFRVEIIFSISNGISDGLVVASLSGGNP